MAKKKTKKAKKSTKKTATKSAKKATTKPKKAAAKKSRRTTHRSKTGKKLYAVRSAEGQFKDIQTYERAHALDIKRSSAEERAEQQSPPQPPTMPNSGS